MIGLLWQRDRADEPIETTVRNAATRYVQRFGEWPTVAMVALSLKTDSLSITADRQERTIEVRPTPRIPDGQVLVGIEGREEVGLPVVIAAPPPPPVVEAARAKRSRKTSVPGEDLLPEVAQGLDSLVSEDALPASELAPGEVVLSVSERAPPPVTEVAPPPGGPTPAARTVKRRSTMLWDPARESQPAIEDDPSNQQLALWD